MTKILKISTYVLAGAALAIIIIVCYLSFALPSVGDAPHLEIVSTPEKIERGRYLAYHVMLCADCHSKRDFSLFAGPPHSGTEFTGGEVFDHSLGFPGRFISANITPYGIGEWTDGELFRLITTGVKRDGEPIFPVMPYHSYGKVDAADIEAVIAYLRTLKPVETDHPKSKADFPVNLIMRTMPQKAEFSAKPSEQDRLSHGKYLFTAAACGDCHTKFEKGSFVGPMGGGGREFGFPDGSVVRSANLTPHETGLKHFTRDAFVQRFKVYADSTYTYTAIKRGDFQTLMPWGMYAGMTENDLASIFDYLQTLAPYDNAVQRFTPTAEK
ncbi:c-type cytochrome [Parapedobacter deserti]|uniref:C-type cytochrome n=1 Tax=Parapedobacter deserti TaxID=1912957 RepID=A0ABV7JJR2_9SPHI